MMDHRLLIMVSAWLAHLGFSLVAYPYVGISVLLPSILLCGLASGLYGFKVGLITLILTHPVHMLAMMYNLGSLHGWAAALEPRGLTGGVSAQLCAVLFISVLKRNYTKGLELTESLEFRIRQRNDELKRISEYITVRSEAEHSRMSEAFCSLIANRQTDLYRQSEALQNLLVANGVPQADLAVKLVQLAKSTVDQVKSMRERLSPEKTIEQGIERALHDLCAQFAETAETDFTVSVADNASPISTETSLNIYRIAMEAINNALRHGKATQITITLEMSEDCCTLKVINNGNPLSRDPDEGLGMRLIQQRADIVNAETRLETTTAGNTLFQCLFPLNTPTIQCPALSHGHPG